MKANYRILKADGRVVNAGTGLNKTEQNLISDQILNYADLYEWDILYAELVKIFRFCSFRANSVPNGGSIARPVNCIKTGLKMKINRVIKHRDLSITLVTNYGYIRFF